MDKQLRVLEQKRYESLNSFCERIDATNNNKICAVGIYNGVILTDKNKAKNKKRFNVKSMKLEYKKTSV